MRSRRSGPAHLDLTRLELRPAPEADALPGAREVVVPRAAAAADRVHPRRVARGTVAMLVALLAPLVVLLAALSLPAPEPVRGLALVAGWIGVGVLGRHHEKRTLARAHDPTRENR